MMKKILLLLTFVLLVACEPTSEDPIITINCDTYPTHKDCTDDQPKDDTTNPIDSNYDNLGYGSTDIYTGRDLVPEECDHLQNIGEWQPVWCDEFEYTGVPDSTLWNYDTGGSGFGNNELQYYTNKDIDNAFVKNGVLTIRTLKESLGGNDYTSARLVTRDKGDWLYGKIQVRAKLPAGLGTWPAIWMLPTDWEYGGWPSSGEIDIMEYVGYQPNTIHGTIHTGKYNHSLGTQVGVSTTLNTAEEEFHVYEIEWEVGVIKLYIDGNIYASFDYDPTKNTEVDSYQAWPFDKQFHLILNTAFGGNWGGAQGIDESILPVDFVIDYVRVYQKDYAKMDQSNPENVTNIRSLATKSDSLFITWDLGVDDVKIKQYHIYVDGDLEASTTVNGYLLNGLLASTSYEISVIAEDFASNQSQATPITFTTSEAPSINNRVEAEDYNTMSGIDTEQSSDTGGTLNVGWVDTDDFLTYVLTVPTSGTYRVDFRLASESNGADFSFYKDTTLLFLMDTVATGGWQNWQTFSSVTFTLNPGTYTFKIVARDGGFNINYFNFEKVN